MKALVYHGPGKKAWEEVPDPKLLEPTDVIVRIDTTTICGTDLHILKGDVPAVTEGRILGHEGVGVVTEVGAAVSTVGVGRRHPGRAGPRPVRRQLGVQAPRRRARRGGRDAVRHPAHRLRDRCPLRAGEAR